MDIYAHIDKYIHRYEIQRRYMYIRKYVVDLEMEVKQKMVILCRVRFNRPQLPDRSQKTQLESAVHILIRIPTINFH